MKTLRVLVPLDGSPLSEAVLPFVARLGQPAVTLLRVLEGPHLLRGGAGPSELEANECLERAAARLGELGVRDVVQLVSRGRPADAIFRMAEEIGPGLLAFATHGEGGPGRRALGRVSGEILHATELPVLAVRPDRAAPPQAPLFDRILVPVGDDPPSWNAIRELEVLGAAGNARLMLFGVVEQFAAGAYAAAAHRPAGETMRDPIANVLAQRCDELRVALERQAQRARDLGFEASFDVEIGRPAPRILERASAAKATLIAMATHGRTGIARLALGSVTEHVLAEARAPLLIVR